MQINSPAGTSNRSDDKAFHSNDLHHRVKRPPNIVCTPVCTNPVSAVFTPWQPSSATDRINAAWPHLPPHVRDTILTLVDSILLGQERHLDEDQPSVQLASSIRINLEGISKDILRRTILKSLRHSPVLYRLNMDNDGWVDSVAMGHLINQLTGTDLVPEYEEVLRVLQEIDLIDRVQFKQGFVRAAYGHSTERFEPSTSAIPDMSFFLRSNFHLVCSYIA